VSGTGTISGIDYHHSHSWTSQLPDISANLFLGYDDVFLNEYQSPGSLEITNRYLE
jgi:hypothetical protein